MKTLVLVGMFSLVGCAAGGLGADGTDAGSTGKTSSDASAAESQDASADAATGSGGDGGDCKAALQEPWQGTGIDTAYVDQDTLMIISGDRYWVFEYSTGSWGAHGHLETLWSTAPTVDGLLPWQSVGVKASYISGTTQTLISGDRYWTIDTTSAAWGATGHLETSWSTAPANNGFKPWDSPNVQTAYPTTGGITVVSSDRYWVLDTTGGTWTDGTLETTWAGAPTVDTKLPWQDTGVSAAWIYNGLQTILSGDRYWIQNATTSAWTDSGHLDTVWAAAPPVDDCK